MVFEGCLNLHLPHEITRNANLMQQVNFIDIFLARHVSGTYSPSSGALDVELKHMVFCTEFLDGCTAPSAPYTRPTQRLSRPPKIQKLRCRKPYVSTQNLCSWWWAYVPETCRAKEYINKITELHQVGISVYFNMVCFGHPCVSHHTSVMKTIQWMTSLMRESTVTKFLILVWIRKTN